MRRLISFLVIAALCLPVAFATEPAQPTYIQIVFDASGSMKHWLYDKKKIDHAKGALEEALAEIEGHAYVSFRVFGHVEHSCEATEQLVDFGVGNRDEIIQAIEDLEPTGHTPLAYAVAQAKADLDAIDGPALKKIVVIGDGEETCEGGVSAIGKELGGAGYDVDSLYLGGSDAEMADLKELADAAGGDFYDSHVPELFTDMLKDAFSNVPTDFELPPMDDMTAATSGVSIEEIVIEEEVAEQFEEQCAIPAQIGGQVLYQEYEIEDAVSDVQLTSGMEVILDVSGSMAGKVEGRAKLDIARDALGEALEAVDPSVDLAFRVYGHRVLKTDQVNSCKDIELLMPFGGDAAEVRSLADGLSPKGWTPIGESLVQAADNLKDYDNKIVLLLSDGEETCGGDPVGKMKALQDQGIQITVHTVGFDVDAATAQQLRDISEATGGTYVDAGSANELKEGLGHVVAEATREVEGCPPLFQNPIKGGPSFEEAVTIEPGAYTFEDFLEMREWYHFKIPVQKGKVVRLYGLAAMPRVGGNHEVGFEESYNGERSSFGIEPYVSTGSEGMTDLRLKEQHGYQLIKHAQVRLHKATDVQSEEIEILEDGDLYLRVGNDFFPVHKDNIFSVQIQAQLSEEVALADNEDDSDEEVNGESLEDDESEFEAEASEDTLVEEVEIAEETIDRPVASLASKGMLKNILFGGFGLLLVVIGGFLFLKDRSK